jgi:hypothetical protein
MDQIIRHMLGEKNVAGVAAIHHPLRHVDAGPGDVGAPAHVGHLAHRSAVNAHPHGKFRVLLKCFGNLECAPGRFLRAVMENQRHSIAVGSLTSCSSLESRTCAVPSAISVSWFSRSFCSSFKSFE